MKSIYKIISCLILISLFTGCINWQKAYTTPYGKVVEIAGDKVTVIYYILNEKKSYFKNTYLHSDGHSYSIGDTYPDFTKQSYQPIRFKEDTWYKEQIAGIGLCGKKAPKRNRQNSKRLKNNHKNTKRLFS